MKYYTITKGGDAKLKMEMVLDVDIALVFHLVEVIFFDVVEYFFHQLFGLVVVIVPVFCVIFSAFGRGRVERICIQYTHSQTYRHK